MSPIESLPLTDVTLEEAGTVVGGAVAPLAMVWLGSLLGATGFAVDLGLISSSRTDLQSNADSAALAGASRFGR